MRKLRFSPFQITIHIGSWLPLAWLVWAFYTNRLTVNPIQAATQHTGKFALVFLVLSLACTPINTVFGFHAVLKVRRALGLYAFIYAMFHMLILIGLDYGFALDLLWADLANKYYILFGAATLLILIPLAITSTRWWMKRLGKNWKRLHGLVYVAGLLVIVHYTLAKKGNLLTLSGAITQPLIYGSIVLVLLLLRIPAIVKGITNLRHRIRRFILTAHHPKIRGI
jgi:sulfoxide reductase heme-binding subunit YedZ